MVSIRTKNRAAINKTIELSANVQKNLWIVSNFVHIFIELVLTDLVFLWKLCSLNKIQEYT